MSTIFKFTVGRHHNVEIPNFTTTHVAKDEKEMKEKVIRLMKESLEDDLGYDVHEKDWKKIKKELQNFLNEKTNEFEKTLEIDNEGSKEEIYFFGERKNGSINLFYNPEIEGGKYENRWIYFHTIGEDLIAKEKAKLEEKTKEELVNELLLARL